MYFQTEDQRYRILAKLSLIALYILLAYDLGMLILGYFLVQSASMAGSGNTIIRDVVFLVAIADMIAIFLVRTYMLKNITKMQSGGANLSDNETYRKLLNITLIIVFMCAAITTYGLVLVILGEKFEVLLLFVAISFLGYQFFRLRPRDFQDGPGKPEE